MERSNQNSPPLEPHYCVTVVGSTEAELKQLEEALRGVAAGVALEVRGVSTAANGTFPQTRIHAIVFTPESVGQLTPADVDAVRVATKPGTCRVYLLAKAGTLPPTGAGQI